MDTQPPAVASFPAPSTPPVTAPRLGPTLLTCLLLAGLFVGGIAHLTRGFEAWTFETLRRIDAADAKLYAPALSLRDAQGHSLLAFDDARTGAPVYLVDFIYTRCMTVCQVLGSEYQRMQQILRDTGQSRVRLLSVSIDPANDTQVALQSHGELHKADPAFWTLTAPRDESAGRDALRQLGVVAIPDGFGGYVHNGSIHLIDARGRVHRIFDYDQWPQALAAASRLARSRSQ